MYGGWDGINKYDDVYILSLPSFEWISIFPGSDEREAHTCHVVGNRMMMTIGGHKARLGVPGPCDWEPNGVALFDMVNMTWTDTFNPESEKYNISSLISSRIGGKYVFSPPSSFSMRKSKVLTMNTTSETGAATVISPKSNWTGGLEAVFNQQLLSPPGSTNSTNSTTTISPPPSSPTPLSKQAIIGISIGSTILLLFVTFAAVQVYKIRRAGANRLRLEGIHTAELEPTTRMPLNAFQELLGSLGKGRNRAALELPGSAPVHTRDRDSNGNPFELPASGEYVAISPPEIYWSAVWGEWYANANIGMTEVALQVCWRELGLQCRVLVIVGASALAVAMVVGAVPDKGLIEIAWRPWRSMRRLR